MTEKDIEFVQRWLMLLREYDPQVVVTVNKFSIAMTGMFIASKQDGQIEVGHVGQSKL